MKFTIWAPDFKDLPTVVLKLPAPLTKNGIQILYGYTQPSKPYDRTLFLHLITPVKTTKGQLKKLTTQLKNLVKKSWDKSHYHIMKVEEEYKAYQSFIYFQLKREKEVISSNSLATPLVVPKLKEPKKTATRKIKKSAKKKTTKKKVTRRKASKKTNRKPVRRSHKKVTKKRTAKKKTPQRKKVKRKTKRRTTKRR